MRLGASSLGWLCAAALDAAAGCAHTRPVVLANPETGFTELASKHFVLRTDLPRPDAHAALAEFEKIYTTFEDVVLPWLHRPRRPIDLVLFSDVRDFLELAPPGATGYFLPHQKNDVESRPTIVMYGGMDQLAPTFRRFEHELTHRFLDTEIHEAPPWLEEGLAEYYSTLRLDGDQVVLGELPVKRVLVDELRVRGGLIDRFVDERVMVSELPSLDELLAADYQTFHAPGREAAFYVAAWALVHMLESRSPWYRQRLSSFTHALASGAPVEQTWRASFGDIAPERLARDFHEYVLRLDMPFRRLDYRLRARTRPEREHRMRAAEVLLLRGRIRPWDSRENIVRAGRDLEQALARAPGSPEARYWMSRYWQLWRRFDDAERDLLQALQAQPREARYWLALAELRLSAELALPPPARSFARVAEAMGRLSELHPSPEALSFMARYWLVRGDADAGLAYARRAVVDDPGCWECADTLRRVLRAKGLPDPDPAPPSGRTLKAVISLN